MGILTLDSRALPLSLSLLFVFILSNATPVWPKGKRSIVISSSHLQSFDSGRQISHSIWMTVWLERRTVGAWRSTAASHSPLRRGLITPKCPVTLWKVSWGGVTVKTSIVWSKMARKHHIPDSFTTWPHLKCQCALSGENLKSVILWLWPSARCSDTLIVSSFHRQSQAWLA